MTATSLRFPSQSESTTIYSRRTDERKNNQCFSLRPKRDRPNISRMYEQLEIPFFKLITLQNNQDDFLYQYSFDNLLYEEE